MTGEANSKDHEPSHPVDESAKRLYSRRRALQTSIVALITGLAGCPALGGPQDGQETTALPNNTEDGVPRQNSLLKMERRVLEEQLAQPVPTVEPTYDYNPITIESDAETPVRSIRAAPASSTTGDRIRITVSVSDPSTFGKMVSNVWADIHQPREYETTIDGRTITFDIYSSQTVAVGTAIWPFQTSEKNTDLLIVRSKTADQVRQLADTYSQLSETV